jgi:hypothetical protein
MLLLEVLLENQSNVDEFVSKQGFHALVNVVHITPNKQNLSLLLKAASKCPIEKVTYLSHTLAFL